MGKILKFGTDTATRLHHGRLRIVLHIGTDRPEVERTAAQTRRLGVGDFRDAIQQNTMLCDLPHAKLLVRGDCGVSLQ